MRIPFVRMSIGNTESVISLPTEEELPFENCPACRQEVLCTDKHYCCRFGKFEGIYFNVCPTKHPLDGAKGEQWSWETEEWEDLK